MKYFFLTFLIASTYCSLAQNLKKIIDKGDVSKLEAYFDKGGSINETIVRPNPDDDDQDVNYSLLTYAVGAECLPCVQTILNRKDQIENFDLVLTEAFIFSLAVGNNEISNLLYNLKPIEKGLCDICHGNNALMVAATYGREDWYFKLKENSDLLYINSDGATLIHAAATGSSKKISDDVLTIEGLDIDKKDSEQLTALDYAAANEEHPDVFKDYIAKGADPNKAWNLIYWWSAFPKAMIPPDIIEQRKRDVWKKDDAGYIPLMNFAFYYFDLEVESGVVANRMNQVLDFMIASFEEGSKSFQFDADYYSLGINRDMLDAMLYIEDFNSDAPVYPKYLTLLGLGYKQNDYNTLTKKDFKRAAKIYGEALVTEWYDKAGIPIE